MSLRITLVFFILLCLISSTVSANIFQKKIIYKDETYVIYNRGKLFWMEIGDPATAKGPPIVYSPAEISFKVWRKRQITKVGIFDSDIFFRDLPPPFGLLLPSDMLYVDRILYFEEEKASITVFNGYPIYFLTALLKRVKNV